MGKVTAVIDGQFGSTGKGVIVSHLADEYDVHIRVGSPNAGHSHKIDTGKEIVTWVNQIIPVGWANREAILVIGRGALVNPRILKREIEEIEKVDPNIRHRLWVDARAGVLSPWHEEAEGHTEGDLHKRIGSTGEGVGAARIDRMLRDPERFKLFQDIVEEWGFEDLVMKDTVQLLNNMRRSGSSILMEGAQGSGLDLVHGTWPYCTTASTGAAGLCADIGIPPQAVTDVVMVVRTYPIRVAGPSGPLKGELTWDELSARVGKDLTPEKTTVTKKVRRIGEWDWDLVNQAVWLNQPNHIALTFADYLDPASEGATDWMNLGSKARVLVHQIERAYEEARWSHIEGGGPRVSFIGTGGTNWSVIDRRK